jgi:hypothetical protein
MEADTYPDEALSTRKKVLDYLASQDILLIGSHFANPVAGKISKFNKNYIFNINK